MLQMCSNQRANKNKASLLSTGQANGRPTLLRSPFRKQSAKREESLNPFPLTSAGNGTSAQNTTLANGRKRPPAPRDIEAIHGAVPCREKRLMSGPMTPGNNLFEKMCTTANLQKQTKREAMCLQNAERPSPQNGSPCSQRLHGRARGAFRLLVGCGKGWRTPLWKSMGLNSSETLACITGLFL